MTVQGHYFIDPKTEKVTNIWVGAAREELEYWRLRALASEAKAAKVTTERVERHG